jgi:hypothetical protein
MAVHITTTQQAAQLHGIKCLVYGKSGAGKTKLAATAPAPIILSAESGILSLREFQIPMIQIKTVADLTEVHQWAQNSAEAKQFATIYIDSISEIGEVVLANAKAQVKDPRQAYGELIEKMMATIKAFRDLPGKNVVMAAKQEPIKDEMTGIVQYGPSMPGSKLGPQLPYLFDEVFRLGVGKTPQGVEYRFLQTGPDLQYDAKDRSGSLDPVERPDLSFVFSKILGVR